MLLPDNRKEHSRLSNAKLFQVIFIKPKLRTTLKDYTDACDNVFKSAGKTAPGSRTKT